jgi:4-methyl-5(b-hydroxyethyl)-thiazole monophosphate biosynthesis
MPSVLVVIANGFEEIEVITPVDFMRRAGVYVTLAYLGEGIHATGRSGVTLHCDGSFEAVKDGAYDCIFLPGGPAVQSLRAEPKVIECLVRQSNRPGWIAAICAAPLVLKDAGLLAGKTFTSHPSTATELPDRLGDQRVVRDGRLLTSRGAGTALDFGLALVEILVSSAKSLEIATAVAN